MWFRNLRIYRLTQPFVVSPEELHAALEPHAFRPCGGLEAFRIGWESPLGSEGAALVHAAGGRLMLCVRREDKVLPAAVIRERLEERVAEIRAREGHPPGRRAKAALRDELVQDLLPRAFARSVRIYAYIDPRNGWILVDSGTARRAEEVLTLLRESLGSLPVRPLEARESQAAVMTGWLLGQADPAPFALGDECELRDPSSEGAVARCRRQELDAEEIRAHLEAGKQVRRLAVSWNDRLTCRLDEDLSVKRLRFSDVLLEEAAEVGEDAAVRFDADFALMALELEHFIPSLLDAFGGEAPDS
jgi:recombination associated protein RdgC